LPLLVVSDLEGNQLNYIIETKPILLLSFDA